MAATRLDLFRRLEQLSIATITHDHDPVFMVAESEQLERSLPGGHTKNLFLKDANGALFLVVAESATRVDLKSLSKKLGAGRLSFGKPDLLLEALGVQPGSVTAFALINDKSLRVSVVIDENLMRHDTINCHPLENNATTNIARQDLLLFMGACGHVPTILDLASGVTEQAPVDKPCLVAATAKTA